MIAASPNCRSRSTSSVFRPSNFAQAVARFVAVTVLPVPPFGENTVTTLPLRPGPDSACPPGGRQHKSVVAVGVEGRREQAGRAARRDDQDRSPRVLADRGQLVG